MKGEVAKEDAAIIAHMAAALYEQEMKMSVELQALRARREALERVLEALVS